jgi:hypothetical protein
MVMMAAVTATTTASFQAILLAIPIKEGSTKYQQPQASASADGCLSIWLFTYFFAALAGGGF